MSENNKKATGIKANYLMVPFLITLVVLYTLVMLMFTNISNSSRSLSQSMQKTGIYREEATSLLAGSSLLCDTSTTFILKPIKEDGELNTSPLAAYAVELTNPRRGNQVVEKFRTYDIDETNLYYIEEAAKSANYVLKCQLHALSLINSIYPIPSFSPFDNIPLVELTGEEKVMSDNEKIALAQSIILSSEYTEQKGAVSQNVNTFVGRLQADSAEESNQTMQALQRNKTRLTIVSILFALVLISIFVAIYKQIVQPLIDMAKQISSDKELDENKGFKEVRLVTTAYNEESEERKKLDAILRSAAETDALTNLPNRYSLERYILDSEEENYPAAALLLDVNYLKVTNDTKGHLAGDKLLCNAAYCISECFSNEDKDNCFRIGGDEFAVIMKNCTVEQIEDTIKNFIELQKKYDISVSVGYAYTDDIANTNFKNLLEEADKNMYLNKERMHKEA